MGPAPRGPAMLALVFLLQNARAETISADATMQATPAGAIAPGLGVRVSDGSPFLSAEARSFGTQRWVGRATPGLDAVHLAHSLSRRLRRP